MNKLGFAIKLASQGACNAIECNKGQWTNKVVDIREYLKLFNGLQGTDNIVTFMSFDEGGCFLTQLRAISGRVGDFLSGWIYIPNTIEATGEEIISAYNYVRNILSQSNLSDLKNDIESFFSKEYPSKEVAAQYVASRGQLYGVRFLGHYTLKEIVGEQRYQPYYSDYKAVFLLNKEEEVTITKEAANNFRDLTNKEIVKISILVPPTNATLQTLGRGTKIHTIDGSDFNQPLLINANSKIPLIFSRIGFEDMKLEVNVTSERQVVDLSNVNITWMKKISASMFTVRNSKQEKIDKGVRISVNGTDITSQDIRVSEEDCRQALVKVSAPDFEVFEQRRSLLIDNFDITLSRKVKQAQTVVELSNGSYGEMTIESKHLPSNYDSPLKGYEFDEDNHGKKVLKLSSWFVWKQRLWGFLGGLAVCALIALSFMIYTWIDNDCILPWNEKKNKPAETFIGSATSDKELDSIVQNGNTGPEEEFTIEDAINYLDSHSVWSKSELEKYPDLEGLFEDMNSFNLSKLISDWSLKLSSSKNFMKICTSAKKTNENGWNPKQSSHNPTYNKPEDEQINIVNYINWLDQDQTPKATNAGGRSHLGIGAGKTNSNAGKARQGNNGKDIFD